MHGGTGAISKVAKESGTKKRRGQSKNQAEERERLTLRVGENEQRLKLGLAADGQPLTPLQIENLRKIVRLQREKLESYTVLGRVSSVTRFD
jgi:hypothetical protein